MGAEASRCPVCRAGFRGQRACARCGADLGPLMEIRARAWRLRQAARRALRRGDSRLAARRARAAADLEAASSRDLVLAATWLEGLAR